MEPLDYILSDSPSIWVFGYGSLLWKPDFCYKSKVIGYIEGYERRFNQGNATFRGEPGKLGRVANLEEKTGGKTWGVAYEISGRREVSKVLQNLYVRELQCGGYDTMITTFYPREYAAAENCDTDPINDTSHSSRLSMGIMKEDESLPDTNDVTDIVSGSMSPPNSFQSAHEKIESKSISVPMDVTSAAITDNSTDNPMRRSESENSPLLKSTSPVTTEDEKISKIPVESSPDFPSASRDGSEASNASSGPTFKIEHLVTLHHPVEVLLYTATPENTLYLGTDTLSNMAHQIVDSKGTAGTNVEYVIKIADYVRKYIPEDNDEYLFALDGKIREELYRRINLQRTELNIVEKVGLDTDLEHHEALLNSMRVRAS